MAPETSKACAHCGLPVTTKAEAAEEVFCCLGCRFARALNGKEGGPVRFLESRLVLSAFLAMGLMETSLVVYGESIYDMADDEGVELVRAITRLFLLGFAFPVFLLLGIPLLRGAWIDLKQGKVRMDGLIALGVVASFVLSIHHTFWAPGPVYYETATMVLVLVTFGRRLEANARLHGKDAAKALAELLPEKARRLNPDGSIAEVACDALAAGDQVVVGPGEAVPADIVVLEGRSEIVAAHITGESRPQDVGPGAEIVAGSMNGTGEFKARVERVAAEGTLGRIQRLLDSPLGMTRVILMTDKLATWLVGFSIAVAALGFAIGWRSGGAGDAIRTGLSVLLVACPCALGLAAPLAYRAVRATLARRGILVSDPRALEEAARVDRVLLDKTGTLTSTVGRLEPIAVESAIAETVMATLVRASRHPLAAAVRTTDEAIADLRVAPGLGVSGRVLGVDAAAGSARFMDQCGFAWPNQSASARDASLLLGATTVAVGWEGHVRGVFALEQRVAPGAAEAVQKLRKLGVVCEILSGDHEAAVAKLAKDLGIEGHGGLTPEAKLAHLNARRERGERVAFVGDGLNDAPCLHAAAVGVAVDGALAAARAEAGVHLLGSDIGGVAHLIAASRRLRSCVRGNLFWTVAYNVLALALAVFGMLNPLLAALSMIASSLVVCWRSWRLYDVSEFHRPKAPTAPVEAPRLAVAGASPGVAAAPAGAARQEPPRKPEYVAS